MNITEHRKLGEALAGTDIAGIHPMLKLLCGAARETYDRWQECGECEGSRVRHNDGWIRHPEQNPCPSCGGTGLRPNQERLGLAMPKWDKWFPCNCEPAYTDRCRHRPDCVADMRDEFPEAAVRAFDKEPPQ